MVFLVGAALAAGVLYFWLRGHWFARVLVFLGLGVLFAVIITNAYGDPTMPVQVAFLAALGFLAAWFAADIPHRLLRRAQRVHVTSFRVEELVRAAPQGRPAEYVSPEVQGRITDDRSYVRS